MRTVSMSLKVREYTSRVLGVIKEKFGLKDKAAALDKFAELYGDEFVDREVKDERVREIIHSTEARIKKHGFHKRSLRKLDALLGAR